MEEMEILPSIFNDVIGPVMRGPSSSHTAASWRVAMMAVQMIEGKLKEAVVAFDEEGAWVTNYEEQGTVLGMNGGLLNIDMADDEMKNTEKIAFDRNVDISYVISNFENNHANSMLLNLISEKGDKVKILAASLGGGSFEIQKIDDHPVKMKGDRHTVLIWANSQVDDELEKLKPTTSEFKIVESKEMILYLFESSVPFLRNLWSILVSLKR